jgi:hypothetical protein
VHDVLVVLKLESTYAMGEVPEVIAIDLILGFKFQTPPAE